METIPDKLLEQRIRNRLIGYWTWVSSEQAQREYQHSVPYIQVPNEMINQWEDWLNSENPINNFHAPTFTDEELSQIISYNKTWDWACNHTPPMMPDLDEFVGTEVWNRLRDAAKDALNVFKKRGLLREDV